MVPNINEVRNAYRVLIDKFMDTIEAKTYLEQQIKSGPILLKLSICSKEME